MKVTILQTDIAWGDPAENIRRADQLIAQQPGSDLYVLPEMWATGFATDPHGIAEPESASAALDWMRRKASSQNCAIAGSLAIQTADGQYRNRHYFINAACESDATINNKVEICKESYYDKHHLFSYGGENRFYTPGEGHTIVEFRGFRLLLLTCYDLRFPVWSRYADSLQYDAIICVANWPESRQNAFQILTRARAMENMAYLVAVNRVGRDPYSAYRGCSAIISPIGKTMACCRANVEDAASCELDLASLRHKRDKFRVLDDRDVY